MKRLGSLSAAILLAALFHRTIEAGTACPQTFSGSAWGQFEAESAARSGASTNTGGYWTTTGNNSNDNASIPSCTAAGCMQQSFTIATADVGYYKIEANVLAPDGSSDSLFVGITGINDTCGGNIASSSGSPGTRRWDITEDSNYQWRYVTDFNNSNTAANARVWYLAAGTYTLIIIGREDGVRVDKVRFQRQVSATSPTVSPTRSITPMTGTPTLSHTRTSTQTPVPGSPTFTASPTRTITPLPTVWGGLPANQRLYGLEYVPFPEVSSGSSVFYGLSVTFGAASGNNIPRNTARWRIVLQDLDSAGISQLQVETRLGAHTEDCLSGYYNPSAYDQVNATSLTLPARPQNLSTTYAWINGDVPITEQFDSMSDPRWVPYKDVLGLPSGETFANNYNWFFRKLAGTGSPAADASGAAYAAFVPQAQWNKTAPDVTGKGANPDGDSLFGCNVDLPKVLGLWRNAVVNERGIFTNIAGVSMYYMGNGGQIGGEGYNNLATGLRIYGGPWDSTSTLQIDEIIGNGWKTGAELHNVSIVKSSAWQGMPWIGELWPDSAYVSDWSALGSSTTSWGNLRNSRQGGSFYREWLNNVTYSNVTYSGGTTFTFDKVRHAPGDYGNKIFMNNTDTPSFGHHDEGSYSASSMVDGDIMGEDFKLSVPNPANATRPWGFSNNLDSGRGESLERNHAPYNTSAQRMDLQLFSGNGALTDPNRGFYAYKGLSEFRSSAAIRGVVAAPSSTKAGFFVISGLSAGSDAGFNFLARYNMLASLRAFLDAGVPISATTATQPSFASTANLYSSTVLRIPPPPRIEITQPLLGENLKGRTSIGVVWKERYARWDGARYTENYPCVDATAGNMTGCTGPGDPLNPGDPSREWHDSEPLVFNVKYSSDHGVVWHSPLTGNVGRAGIRMEGSDDMPADSITHTYNYVWDVSALPAGEYLFRIECYRQNVKSHYAYHEVKMDLKP